MLASAPRRLESSEDVERILEAVIFDVIDDHIPVSKASVVLQGLKIALGKAELELRVGRTPELIGRSRAPEQLAAPEPEEEEVTETAAANTSASHRRRKAS